MKRWIDLAIAFSAGIVCTLLFANQIGPYEVKVSGNDPTPVIVRINKLSGRTQLFYKGWKDLR